MTQRPAQAKELKLLSALEQWKILVLPKEGGMFLFVFSNKNMGNGLVGDKMRA